jgi:hypothetical protein
MLLTGEGTSRSTYIMNKEKSLSLLDDTMNFVLFFFFLFFVCCRFPSSIKRALRVENDFLLSQSRLQSEAVRMKVENNRWPNK